MRELNAKLLAEIAKLRKENAEIPELREKFLKFAEVEAENARLKQLLKRMQGVMLRILNSSLESEIDFGDIRI